MAISSCSAPTRALFGKPMRSLRTDLTAQITLTEYKPEDYCLPCRTKGRFHSRSNFTTRPFLSTLRMTAAAFRWNIRSASSNRFHNQTVQWRLLGLGLDTVQRVVAKHFGAVAFDTSVHGTTFHVRLPVDRVGIYYRNECRLAGVTNSSAGASAG